MLLCRDNSKKFESVWCGSAGLYTVLQKLAGRFFTMFIGTTTAVARFSLMNFEIGPML